MYDEPTAGLDPVASTVVEDLIRELHEKHGEGHHHEASSRGWGGGGLNRWEELDLPACSSEAALERRPARLPNQCPGRCIDACIAPQPVHMHTPFPACPPDGVQVPSGSHHRHNHKHHHHHHHSSSSGSSSASSYAGSTSFDSLASANGGSLASANGGSSRGSAAAGAVPSGNGAPVTPLGALPMHKQPLPGGITSYVVVTHQHSTIRRAGESAGGTVRACVNEQRVGGVRVGGVRGVNERTCGGGMLGSVLPSSLQFCSCSRQPLLQSTASSSCTRAGWCGRAAWRSLTPRVSTTA